MPRDHLYYSCDSHFVEAPEVFAGLEERFGERAPLIVQDPPGREGIYVMFPQAPVAVPVGRFGIAGARLDLPETQERMKHGWDRINPGVRDPAARLDEQREDGIVGEVMYPSINMLAFSHPDREVVQAVFERHNDWVADYQSHAPDRLIGAACLPLPDVPEAIAEMERGLGKGLRAFAIPCTAPPSLPYSDPHYEPFWSAAEEAGVPLTLHIFCGAEWGMSLPSYWNQVSAYALALAGVAWSAETLITGGVFARHPNLKVVFAEWETGWVAHWLQRLDHAAYRVPKECSPDMTEEPSFYFRRNCYVTFEDDEIGVRTRDLIGVDRMLWGNDYPHHDSIWPNSMPILDRIMAGVPDDEEQRMTWDNVIELYDIDAGRLRASLDA